MFIVVFFAKLEGKTQELDDFPLPERPFYIKTKCRLVQGVMYKRFLNLEG